MEDKMVTEPEILYIPELSKYPKILQAARNCELILFIGAGISCIVNCPDWGGFANGIIDLFQEKGLFEYRLASELKNLNDPRRQLSICWEIIEKRKDVLTPDEWRNKILPTNDSKNIYDKLLEFKAPIVTTNYDLNIERAIDRRLKEKNQTGAPAPQATSQTIRQRVANVQDSQMSYFREEDMTPAHLIPGRVLHLHGSIDEPDSMIVTTRQYIKAYYQTASVQTNPTIRASFLKRLFQEKTVLFLGYSLGELEILEHSYSQANDSTTRHYLLFAAYSHSADFVKVYMEYFRKLGIQMIPYCQDVIGPGQVAKIVDEWAPQIGAIAGEPPTLQGLKAIDDVI